MGTTLQHGIFLPAEGERNCYAGLASNWTILDGVVGGYSSHAANLTIHVTAADKEAWNGKADASALTAHTGDTTIHVTAEDKAKWDAVTTKANDADVVHKEGAENIPGLKTFTNTIKSKKEIELTGNRLAYILPEFSASYSGLSLCTYSASGAVKIGSWKLDDNDNTKHVLDSSLGYLSVTTGAVNSVNIVYLIPRNTTDSKLGDSTNKWKEINGLNPGALSLPDLTAGVDISAYITNITGASNINKFTPTADGWISIGLSNADFIEIYIPASLMGATFTKSTMNSNSLAFMPVLANKEVKITLKGSSIGWAKFYPCQGNI